MKLAVVRLGFDNVRTLQQTQALGLQANGPLSEAEATLRDGLRRLDAIFARDDRNHVRCLGRLSTVLPRQGRHDEAPALLARKSEAVARLAGADSRDALVVLHGRALLSAELHGDLRTALPLVHAEALVLLKPRTGRPGVVTRRAGCHRWSGPNRHCGRRRRGCGPATRRARPNWHANAISRGPWCTAPTRPLSPARWGGVTPVVKVDGRVICTGWPGAVTALVSQRYLARVLAP